MINVSYPLSVALRKQQLAIDIINIFLSIIYKKFEESILRLSGFWK